MLDSSERSTPAPVEFDPAFRLAEPVSATGELLVRRRRPA
jgi:hypothetical protein